MPDKNKRTATKPGARRRQAVVDQRLVHRLAGGRSLTPAERRRRLAIAHTVGSINRPEGKEKDRKTKRTGG